MLKKVLICIGISIIIFIGIFYLKEMKNKDKENNIFSEIEVSEKYVTDDCIDEWEDYKSSLEKTKDVVENIKNEKQRFIVKEENSIIKIFLLNDNNEEILYTNTGISTEYLAKEDVKNLKSGIEVSGIEELNELLENYE